MEIACSEFKAKCLELLDRVNRTGEPIVVTKRGKPVAKVMGFSPAKPWLSLRGKGRFHGDAISPVIEESEIQALRD